MKKYSAIILTVAALALSFTSCKKSHEYVPGEKELDGCLGVYFPQQEILGDNIYSPDDPTVAEITVARENSDNEATVPYVITGDTDIIQAGDIVFAAGQTETTLTLNFPKAETGTKYGVSVQVVDNAFASIYGSGATSFDFSVLRVQWKWFTAEGSDEPATINWTQAWWEDVAVGKLKYYEVDGVRTCVTVTEDHEGFWAGGTGEEWTLIWYTNIKDNDGNQIIEIPRQKTGYYSNNYSADVLVYDWYHYWVDLRGESLGSFADFAVDYGADFTYHLSYYDGKGGFYLWPAYYYMDGVGGWKQDAADIIGIAEGYVRTDFSIAAESDYSVDGQLPVYFETGRDVKSIKFVAAEGEISASAAAMLVNAINDGSAKDVTTISEYEYDADEDMNYYATSVSFEATGTYTIVAVGCDEAGVGQSSTTVACNYIAAGDAEEHAVKVSVGTEAISERYAQYGYDATNSFGYYIDGEDLTEVHVGVVASAKYNANPAAYNAAIKAGKAVSDDILASINAFGGYASVYAGLAANTAYTVLLWATNGDLDTVVTAAWTTDGLPNEVIAEGTAYAYTIVLNQLFWGTKDVCYDEGLNLEYNPNTSEYEVPAWGNNVTLRFTEKDGVVSVPIQSVGYTHSSYGTFYVMDVALCDSFFGDGAADDFGYDTTKKGSKDADGNYVFELMYASTAGYSFGVGQEFLYIKGAPATAEAASVKASFDLTKAVSSPVAVSPAWTSPFEGVATKISYKHEPKTVSVATSPIAPKAISHKSNRSEAPVQL